MAQRFLAPELIVEGLLKQKGTVSNDEHVITRGWAHDNLVNGIHSDSANYAEVIAEGGVNKLKLKPLTVTSVTTNSSAASLSAFVSDVYDGSNFQEGDIVFLTSPSPTEAYIHNGGTAGTTADWEQVNSGLSDAQIRAKLSASSGINYNSTSGEFTADQAEIRGFFSAGTGLSFSAGEFSLNATSDNLTEGSSNLFHSEARVRSSISLATVASPDVQLLQYNSSTGALSVELSDVLNEFSAGTGLTFDGGEYSFTGDTDNVSEGVSNLYFTDARARGALSAGSGLSYNSGTGAFALNADSDDITEGATNLYFTDARARGALSADGIVAYNSSTGAFSWAGDSDDVGEGSVNLYHTSARVRSSVDTDDTVSENILDYNSSTGKFSVPLSYIRKEFDNQSLTANTGLALTHNLQKQLVHVSAMDSSGNHIDLEIVYTSTTVVTVKSTVGLTGVDIVVSL